MGLSARSVCSVCGLTGQGPHGQPLPYSSSLLVRYGGLFHGSTWRLLHNLPVAKNGGGKILIIKARKTRRGTCVFPWSSRNFLDIRGKQPR
ncbi:hypothetical protein M426DRAFT_323634 [Hypoxylon sp. CI-4A]|nr:hypothetical protein M426DRAFT_323634 [Hypoxylon sp. CI-4A]